MDWGQDWAALEANDNPFALVVMAHLKAQAVKEGEARKQWKLHLVRLLYERGYSRHEILELFRFIDWLLVLPEGLDKAFWVELSEFEEARGMSYVTSVERIGIEKGLQMGLQQGLQKGLQKGLQQGSLQEAREMVLEAIVTRFGVAPEEVVQAVNAIETREMLRSLHRQVINCADLEAFREVLCGWRTAKCFQSRWGAS